MRKTLVGKDDEVRMHVACKCDTDVSDSIGTTGDDMNISKNMACESADRSNQTWNRDNS